MSGEYTYRICGVGPGVSESSRPVTVSAGSTVTIVDTQAHRRSRRKTKRWPHAPTKRIPLPESDVAYYRVLRMAPLMTHTGRELLGDDAPWESKGGRDVQMSRMIAKARRRQMKEGGTR